MTLARGEGALVRETRSDGCCMWHPFPRGRRWHAGLAHVIPRKGNVPLQFRKDSEFSVRLYGQLQRALGS